MDHAMYPALLFSGYDVGLNRSGYIDDGHCLQPDLPRSGEDSVEKNLAAEEHILHAGYLLDIDGYGGLEACHVAGIHNELLSGLQFVFHQFSIDFNESGSAAGQLLHDKSFTAEETGADFLIKMDGELDPCLRGKECAFLYDKLPARHNFNRNHLAGEAGTECDHAIAVGGIDILEHAFPGECLGEHFSHAAAFGLHLHIRGHPNHGALFRDHLLTVRQVSR